MLTLMRLGWGQENPAFRQLFTSQFIPGGTKEQADWFNELQRISTLAGGRRAHLLRERRNRCHRAAPAGDRADARDACARRRPRAVRAGRRMAAGIPGARFVPLRAATTCSSKTSPPSPAFCEEMRTFLAS